MPGLILWKDQEINKLRRDMDRLFTRLWDDFGMPFLPRTVKRFPYIALSETEDNLIIKAEVPGINPEDLEISITDDTLTIKGKLKGVLVNKREDYHIMEKRHGFFSRSIQLPCKVIIEDVKATYKKGFLYIIMPKYKPDIALKIKIKIG